MEEKKKSEIANYLKTRVSPFVTPMMEEMAKKQPEDILEFAKKYIEGMIQKRNNTFATDQSESDSEQQKELDRKMQMRRQNRQKKHSRQAISAQVYGVFNKKEDFKPKIIPKDSSAREKIEKLITKSILFENLSESDMAIVVDAMTIQEANQNQSIITQGEQGDVLFIVHSGEYACSKVINGKQTYLKTYKTGQYFGELALMYTAPRAATIKCTKPGTLFGLDRQTFKHIVQEAAKKKRQTLNEILSKVQILSEIDPHEKEQLCDIVKEEIFENGTYVVRQGEEGNKFYIVGTGSLIAQKEEKKVYEFGEGDYFGEIALVRNTPRQASVKCLTKCRLLSVERDAFKRMFGPIQEILKRNEDKYKKYMST